MSNNFYGWAIAACWIVFLVWWFVSAFSAKRNLRGGWWWRGAAVRSVALVLIIIFFHFQFQGQTFDAFWASTLVSFNSVVRIIGVVLAAAGIALAIWARVYLGRNWGMPMSLKESPELVTTGPYAYIRHPIYSGVLLAMIGSLLANTLVWIVPLVIAGTYFLYSAVTEERIMTKEFPDVYPQYKKRTKMLIPFIL